MNETKALTGVENIIATLLATEVCWVQSFTLCIIVLSVRHLQGIAIVFLDFGFCDREFCIVKCSFDKLFTGKYPTKLYTI